MKQRPSRMTPRPEPKYDVPNPFETYEQWRRFHHDDLEDLSRIELTLERAQCVLRLTSGSTNPWVFERYLRVDRRLHEIR